MQAVLPLYRAWVLTADGPTEEAQEEVEDLLRFDPNFNDARFRQRNLHFDREMVEWAARCLLRQACRNRLINVGCLLAVRGSQ